VFEILFIIGLIISAIVFLITTFKYFSTDEGDIGLAMLSALSISVCTVLALGLILGLNF